MSTNFFNEEVTIKLGEKRNLKSWIKFVVESHHKKLGEINFVFASDEYVIEINREYLKHNYFTDIITFNYNSLDLVSGDIFISVDTVKRNANTYSVSFVNELHRVIIHGVLHLIGFDDKTEELQMIMKEQEDRSLEILYSKSFLK